MDFRKALLIATALLAVHAARAETDREYCERQEGPARVACLRSLGAATPAPGAPAASAAATPFHVENGIQVDATTFKGFQTWRAAACDRCHGAQQQGLVGPSLIASLKVLSKDEFRKTVTEGRLEKGMPSFKGSDQVMQNLDALYAYLKGRSDGVITQAHVQPLAANPVR